MICEPIIPARSATQQRGGRANASYGLIPTQIHPVKLINISRGKCACLPAGMPRMIGKGKL